MIKHLRLLLAIATLLGGCALGPLRDDAAGVAIPARWAGEAPSGTPEPATDLRAWWQRFNDPLLSSLIDRALAANTDVRGAQAALRQARALRDVSAAALLPALGGSASVQRGRSGGENTTTQFRVGLDAGWELDLFGANRSALAGADATARASSHQLGDVQRALAAEVALAYIGLRSSQQRLAIARDNLAGQAQTLQITQWRLQAGLVSSLETEQALAASAQTRAQLPGLETSITQTRHALAVLTGLPPAALNEQLATAAPVPQPAATLALALPAETLRQRPDVRAAEERVSAAWARLRQADAARAPSFRLGGSLGLNALTLGALTHGASLASALLANVSMPLLDGGAALAQVRAQRAALEQAHATYDGVLLAALREVEDALVALRNDRERLTHLQAAAQAAANAALMANQRYGSGLVDFQTVLDTHRNQLGTQDSVAGATADVSAGHVRLYKALGGGWSPQVSSPLSLNTPDRTPPP